MASKQINLDKHYEEKTYKKKQEDNSHSSLLSLKSSLDLLRNDMC